jgi:SAM-dependent methyltransferase
MYLIDLIQRVPVNYSWAENGKIPWNDPDFSQRMLQEHLSQSHDAASRRITLIDRHVEWIDRVILQRQPSNILDLGCGPGLYMLRLAQRGHRCHGIDFSPASIAYARESATGEDVRCIYDEADVRQADYGTECDLIMFIFGELNVFSPADMRHILTKANSALGADGQLLLEVHTYDVLKQIGESSPSWHTAQNGLFSDQAYLCLSEHFWSEEQSVAVTRYFIVDAQTSKVTVYGESLQAYTEEEYRRILAECGFTHCTIYPSLQGQEDISQTDLFVIVAHR